MDHTEHTSAEENASDVSIQHYQHENREQTPDYDSAPNTSSRPTTSNYMLDNGVHHEDIYNEYSQYDQTNDAPYSEYKQGSFKKGTNKNICRLY